MTNWARWLLVCLLSIVSGPAFAQDDTEEPTDEAAGDEADEEEEDEGPPKDCPVPDKVHFGAHVNNIQVFDLKMYTYEFDTYLWFRWCNPDFDPATSMEFVNPSELWGFMITPAYEEPEELEDGSLYQVVRLTGLFSTKIPLHNYPFDRQSIGPILEDSLYNVDAMIYVLDEVTINPNLVLPGYVIGTPFIEIVEHSYPTHFGDPRVEERPVHSRAYVRVPLSRPLVSQLSLLLVPLMCVMVCASLMYVLGPTFIDSRISVGTTAMLTIVALQLTYAQELPDVGYLMLMDKVYLVSYVFVIVGLGVVVFTAPLVQADKLVEATKLHRTWLLATACGYLLLVGALISFAAAGG